MTDGELPWRELWAIAVRARPWVREESLGDGDYDYDAPEVAEAGRRRDAALELWRSIALRCAARAEVGAIPLLGWMLQIAGKEPRDRYDTAHALEDLVSHLAPALVDRPDELSALSEDPRDRVRAAVARGLSQSEHPVAQKTLERMCADVDPGIRAIAQRALGLPWWAGLFASDPESGLATDGERDAFAAVRTVLAERWLTRAGEEILSALAALPDAVAIPCAVVLARRLGARDLGPRLLVQTAERGAPPERLREILASFGQSYFTAEPLKDAAASASAEVRLSISLACVAELTAPVPAVRAPYARVARRRLPDLLDVFWPEGAPAEPLLVAMLGGSVHGAAERTPPESHLYWRIAKRIDADDPSIARHRDALRAAALAGLPGAFANLPEPLVERLVPERRAAEREKARADLASEDPAAIARAISSLTGELRDPADPDPDTFRQQLYDDPRTRAAALDTTLDRAPGLFRRARRDLRAGELTLLEAAHVLAGIGVVGADLAEIRMAYERDHPVKKKARGRRRLTAKDWVAFHALRASADLDAISGAELAEIAFIVPPGPLSSDDLALAERVAARLLVSRGLESPLRRRAEPDGSSPNWATGDAELARALVLFAQHDARFEGRLLQITKDALAAEPPLRARLLEALAGVDEIWDVPEAVRALLVGHVPGSV